MTGSGDQSMLTRKCANIERRIEGNRERGRKRKHMIDAGVAEGFQQWRVHLD